MMTSEELLKPRYKIIAAIPFKEEEDFWRVGEILDRNWGWHGDDEDGFKYHISDYPHLFKKLEWWEERKVEEMPEYVKLIIGNKTAFVHKVEKWDGCNAYGIPMYYFKNQVGYVSPRSVTDLLPASYDEYKMCN